LTFIDFLRDNAVDFVEGLQAYYKAHQFILSHTKVWWYFVLPGVLSTLYFGLAIFLGFYFLFPGINSILNWLSENLVPGFILAIDRFLYEFPSYSLSITIHIGAFLLLLFMIYLIYKPLMFSLFSGVLSSLSSLTETFIQTQHRGSSISSPSSMGRVLPDLKDIGAASFRNRGAGFIRSISFFYHSLFRETLFSVASSFVPVFGSAIMFFVQTYYSGCSLCDIALERHEFSAQDSRYFCKAHIGGVLGIGLPFLIMMFVPVLGWFSAPIYGVIAGTIFVMNKLKIQ